MTIPKRPDWPCGDYGDAGDLLDHYRAVARVALEVLRKVFTAGAWYRSALELDHGTDGEKLEAEVAAVLREIEESGWKP